MTTRLLLNPAPPEIAAFAKYPEWYKLSDAQKAYTIQMFCRLKAQEPGLLEAAMRFAEAVKPVLVALREAFPQAPH